MALFRPNHDSLLPNLTVIGHTWPSWFDTLVVDSSRKFKSVKHVIFVTAIGRGLRSEGTGL
jgi:hypothetical protein